MLYANDKFPTPVVCGELIDYIPSSFVEVVRGSDRSILLHKEKCPAFFVLWKAELNHVFLGGNP